MCSAMTSVEVRVWKSAPLLSEPLRRLRLRSQMANPAAVAHVEHVDL